MSAAAKEHSIAECVEHFRGGFRALGIPETDVRVSWDTAQGWARVRVRAPSGEALLRSSVIVVHDTAERVLWREAQRIRRAVTATRKGATVRDALVSVGLEVVP